MGCGGSGDSTSVGGTTTSEAAARPAPTVHMVSLTKFRAAASRACEAGDRRKVAEIRAATGAKGLNITQVEGEHLITTVVLPIYTEVNEELAALPMPRGYEAEIESIVSEVRAGIIKAEAEPDLALQGKAFLAPDEAITKLGLKLCVF